MQKQDTKKSCPNNLGQGNGGKERKVKGWGEDCWLGREHQHQEYIEKRQSPVKRGKGSGIQQRCRATKGNRISEQGLAQTKRTSRLAVRDLSSTSRARNTGEELGIRYVPKEPIHQGQNKKNCNI